MNADTTQPEAERITGLSGREMTSANERYSFLRCQLGRPGRVTRPNPRDGSPMTVSIFNLVGFGSNWAAAVKSAS